MMKREQNIEQRAKSKEQSALAEGRSWKLEDGSKSQFSVAVGGVILSVVEGCSSSSSVALCDELRALCGKKERKLTTENTKETQRTTETARSSQLTARSLKKEINRKERKEDAKSAKVIHSSSLLMKGVATKEPGDWRGKSPLADATGVILSEVEGCSLSNSAYLCVRLSDLCGKKKNLTTEYTKKTQRNTERKIEACHLEGSMTERSVTFQQISNRFLSSFGMTARGYFFTLCSRKRDHLPQGRTTNEAAFSACSLKLTACSLTKENSTVNNIVNLPQRRDCIYNTSLPVPSNMGSEAEGPTIRACSVLLN